MKKEIVNELINSDLDSTSMNGYNLITKVIKGMYGDDLFSILLVIKMLLDNGADINEIDSYGDTPLINLIKECECADSVYGITKFMIKYGVDLNFQDKNGNTPLFNFYIYTNHDYDCCINDANNYIELLVKNCALINKQNNEGMTPLLYMVENYKQHNVYSKRKDQELSYMNALIKNGADINFKNNKGETPLIVALQNKCDIDFINYLLDNGANLNLANNSGLSPIYYSLDNCNKDYKNVMELLVSKGADINVTVNGQNLIANAVYRKCDIKYIRYLKSLGLSVSVLDDNNKTPLERALGMRQGISIIKLLLEDDSNVDFFNYRNEPALYHIKMYGLKKQKKFLYRFITNSSTENIILTIKLCRKNDYDEESRILLEMIKDYFDEKDIVDYLAYTHI